MWRYTALPVKVAILDARACIPVLVFVLDAGMDGLWVDNWSAWDSWNAEPILFAFGD